MIAGGKGHTTDILINTIKEKYDIKDITKRSEAELFKYLIEENYGVDNTILLEKESTNCGENIQFAFKLLKKEDIIVKIFYWFMILLCKGESMQLQDIMLHI